VDIEVVDQGLGIVAERREALNKMFRDPPDFGLMALSDDARIGFFVVANLAHQHGIQVSLMESTYGGVRAGALIPTALMSSPDPEPRSGRPPEQTSPSLTFPVVVDNSEPAQRRPKETDPPYSAPETIGAEQLVAPDADDRPALPRRRRQANLASQLKQETTTSSEYTIPEPDFDRTARHAQDTVAAFQQGTRRGRDDDEPEPWTVPNE
jgi:hypothetical protein